MSLLHQSDKKNNDFSIPYIAHRVLLVVRSDQQDIRSFKDLTDKTVAQILGTDLSRFAKELKSHLVFSHNFEQSLQLLLSKRTDATMIPDIPFFNFLERRPHDGNLFKIADRMKDNSAVAFMMRKGNNKLTRSINEILCAIHLDGTYKKIFDRYFDKNIISSVPGCSS
nr:hypothetical protein LOCUS_590 [Candidatus Liberibacter asiaticus]